MGNRIAEANLFQFGFNRIDLISVDWLIKKQTNDN